VDRDSDVGAAETPDTGVVSGAAAGEKATGSPAADTPRDRRRARTREEILAAGRTLLLQRGVEGFTLREVARAADYSTSALYRHFRNKDELVSAVAMEGLRVLGAFLVQVPEQGPARERVLKMGAAYLRFATESPEYFALVFNRLSLPPVAWEHLLQVAWPFTLVVEAFARGVREGRFVETPERTVPVMALGFWSLVHGAASLRAGQLRDVTDDIEQLFLEGFRTYLDGLTRTEPDEADTVREGKDRP
jgi:AcrR family transcriptional regulator